MTDNKIHYQIVMQAQMEPDLYAGDNCDEVNPRWHATAEGDRDSEYISIVELDAKHFPAGTKVSISVPCCPACGINAYHPRDEQDKCECGFDWPAWTQEKYQ